MVKKDSRPGGGVQPKRSKTNEENLRHLYEPYKPKPQIVAKEENRMPRPTPIVVLDTNPRVIKKRG